MRSPWVNIGTPASGGYAPEDLDDFLEATEEFELEHHVEQGHVLRQLTRMLRKLSTAKALRSEFDYRQES